MRSRCLAVLALVLGGALPVHAQLSTSGNAASQGIGAGAATNFWNFRLTDGTSFYNAATDRTAAAGPFSFRLSDGAAFYDAAKTGQFPAALVSGRLDVNLGAWLGSTAPTVGQKTMANSLPVAFASDQSTLTVSGTVTANAGTNLNTSALALDASVTGLQVSQGSATSGQKGGLNLGAVTTAAPTYTTAQSSPLSLTTAGALRTDGSGATQPVSGTVTSNQGGSPWQVQSNSANISTETTLATLSQAQASTTSGQKGPIVQGAVTTAAPSYTTAQTDPLSLTTAGALRTDESSIAGTTTLTGNGVTGAGSQRVTIASDNTPFAVGNTQGSTTSGQSGPLAQGAVTTAAPSYTTAQTSPLSLTTAGGLRSDIASYGGTATSLGQKAMTASMPVTPASDWTPAELTTTGTISAVCADPCDAPASANSAVVLATQGLPSVVFHLTSTTLVGTVKFEASVDGTVYGLVTTLSGGLLTRGSSFVTPAARDDFIVNIPPGYGFVRVRCSAFTSGTSSWYARANNVESYSTLLPVSSWPTSQVPQRSVLIGGSDGSTSCNGTGCMFPATTKNTAPVGTEYGIYVRPVPGGTYAASGTLSAACADPCQGAGAVSTSQISIDINTQSTWSVALTAVSAATMTVKFEGSYDNNDWFTLNTLDWTSFNRASSFANPATPPRLFSPSTRPGMRYARVRCSAFTSGSATFQVAASNAAIDSIGYTAIAGTQAPPSALAVAASDNSTGCNGAGCSRALIATNGPATAADYAVLTRDSVAATYSASTTAKTATAAGTAPFFSICGNATTVMRILRVSIGGTVATTAINADVRLQKTSTATSAGTAVNLVKVPHDSNSAGSSASLVNYYTALATAGALVGTVSSQTIFLPVAPAANTPIIFDWTSRTDTEAPTLRGTAQCLEGSFGTTTANAPTLTVAVTWTEK